MESPVVLDKPPEYHSKGSQDNDKGFPFDDSEAEDGAWSDLAARHPDIAARLRARPSGWARKRRPSQNNQPDHDTDDFVSGLGEHFNRFPFDDIPPEFREHIPGHWGQRYVPQERAASEQYHQAKQPGPQSNQSRPAQSTISTQTEENQSPTSAGPSEEKPEPLGSLPQYGLRNTVDLGQKTPADPSLVDAENERNQRSMSAPPDNRVPTPGQHNMGNMMGGNPPPMQTDHQEHNSQSNVRHIPIFVEGRDEPIINKSHPEPAANYSEPKPQQHPQPQPQPQPQYAAPPPEREYYFERDPAMGFDHPPNFSRTFGSPFGKGFRQGPQPFAPQKSYQQNATPQGRSQSPKPQVPPQQYFTQIPVHHDHAQQQKQPQYQQPPQQHHQPPQQHQQQPPQQRQASPQPSQQQAPPQQTHPQQFPPPPNANDPIAKILSIQKDVLDLMTDVENFVGTKKDKRYIYLDEMLTRNLIKLDDIETEGKENIRQARKEAIKCIQKCIAVLEAKADGKIPTTPQPNVEMKLDHNGQVEKAESEKPIEPAQNTETKDAKDSNQETMQVKEKTPESAQAADNAMEAENKRTPEEIKESVEETKGTPKKTKKVIKKRDKSKDKKEGEEPPKENSDVNTQDKDSKQADGAQPMETEASAVPSQ